MTRLTLAPGAREQLAVTAAEISVTTAAAAARMLATIGRLNALTGGRGRRAGAVR